VLTEMDKQSFFWRILAGELPPPKAGETLGIVFTQINADAGTIEVELQGRPEFTNPAGNIQGGFLAAMLDDTMGPALLPRTSRGNSRRR
jgi:acyl-coenzyme A thioesterase PaaI-like protein